MLRDARRERDVLKVRCVCLCVFVAPCFQRRLVSAVGKWKVFVSRFFPYWHRSTAPTDENTSVAFSRLKDVKHFLNKTP